MSKIGVGVIEGFFGPEWSWESRHQFCETIAQHRAQFYIYAPKRDPYLRKNWTELHPTEMWTQLKNLRQKCRALGIQFGLGLSPFEIHEHWNATAQAQLQKKVEQLQELNPDYLGLFFDDMKGSPDLAENQIEIVEFVRQRTKTKLWFCPTYYSDDPILDKVFGQRPAGYLEKISALSPEVEILWTGNKVISKTITEQDLEHVAGTLKRKPLIWDNCFANDGPKQCKFLRLRPLEGRDQKAFDASAGWALNLMNQPNLSEILFASSLHVLKFNESSRNAYRQVLQHFLGAQMALSIESCEQLWNTVGLDQMNESQKDELRKLLPPTNRFTKDIHDWLDGKYIVGPECLTD